MRGKLIVSPSVLRYRIAFPFSRIHSLQSVKRPPQYDAWIDLYSGDEFEKLVLDCVDMLDSVGKDLASKTAAAPDGTAAGDDESATSAAAAAKATLAEMKKHFIMSCKLEHMFWDQAQTTMGWPAVLCERSDARSRKHLDLLHYDSIS